MNSTVKEELEKLLHHDRLAREAREALLAMGDREGLIRLVLAEIDTALGLGDEGKLETLASFWGKIPSRRGARVLLTLLTSSSAAVRRAALSALAAIAEESFGDFGEAVKDYLGTTESPGPELEEVAFLIADTGGEAGALELILEMLDHRSSTVVAHALEVAGEFGWEARIRAKLGELARDRRKVTLRDEEEGEAEFTLGELATEVSQALRALGRGRRV